jgi:hypothetical protein
MARHGPGRGALVVGSAELEVAEEGVLKEARELTSVLTGKLRIRQGLAPLSIVNIVGMFDDGREEKFPPHGRPSGPAAGVYQP